MKNVKAFITIDSLIDNASAIVAPFGELSDYSRSYAKDKGIHTSDGAMEVSAILYSCLDDDGEEMTITEAMTDDMLVIADWISLNIKNATIPVVRADALSYLEEYFNPQDYTAVNIGSVSTHNLLIGPDYVELVKDSVKYTLWFQDTAFRTQYPYFVIDVIPPVDSIDDLMRPKEELVPLVRSPITITQQSNVVKGDHVSTAFQMLDFTVNIRNNSTVEVLTYWGVNLYGSDSFSVEEQKAAIREYILTNSAYDKYVWAEVLPGIFTPNEIYVIPCWDKISVENQTVISGIYSPCVKQSEITRLSRKFSHEYPDVHIDEYVTPLPILYKSLLALTVGSPTNYESKFTINDLHPNYSLIRSSDLDYHRISPGTQDFMSFLYETVILAEYFKEGVTLPVTLSLVKRGEYEYLTGVIDGLTVLVLTKYSYMSAEGYDWEPNPNQFYTPGSALEPEIGSLLFTDSHISIHGKLTFSGKVTDVDMGTSITVTITDSLGGEVLVTPVASATGTFSYSEADISSLEKGTINIHAMTTDKYDQLIEVSKSELYDVPSGVLSNIHANVNESEIVIYGEANNFPIGGTITYHIEDITSQVVSGTTDILIGNTFNTGNVDLANNPTLVTGNLTITLRSMDLLGALIEEIKVVGYAAV